MQTSIARLKHSGAALLLVATIAAFSGCAKEVTPIGQGDPQGEFKSCLDLTKKNQYEDAIQCMEMFKARYPKTPEGIEALLKIGDIQFQKKEYLLSAESYQAFLRLYPNHPRADYAHYRSGVAYYKESPKAIDRDQEYLDDAIEELRTVVLRYQGSEYMGLTKATLHIALKRVARRNFYVGHFYYRTGEYLAAIPRFVDVAEKFPESGLADRSLFLVIKSSIALNRMEAAKEAFGILSVKYPESKYTKKAEKDMLSAAKQK